jgi:hypothetical protein
MAPKTLTDCKQEKIVSKLREKPLNETSKDWNLFLATGPQVNVFTHPCAEGGSAPRHRVA